MNWELPQAVRSNAVTVMKVAVETVWRAEANGERSKTFTPDFGSALPSRQQKSKAL